MYTIYLLENFNNYYNRRIIRYDTLTEYLQHQSNNNKAYINFDANFIPNDGVSTEHIVNAQQLTITWNPDYILLVNSNEIVQRWFVIDSVRTTMGQYRLSLKRDTIADYFNETISAPCFIEKATLPNSNPLIYNSENFSVNQIKTSETLLKDKTGCSWIVGYMAGGELPDITDPPTGMEIETDTLNITIPPNLGLTTYSALSQHPMNKYIRDTASSTKSIRILDEKNDKLNLSIYTNSIGLANNGYFMFLMSLDDENIQKVLRNSPDDYPAVSGFLQSSFGYGESYNSNMNMGWALNSNHRTNNDKINELKKAYDEMILKMNEDDFNKEIYDFMINEKGISDDDIVFNSLKSYDGASFILVDGSNSYQCQLSYVEEFEEFIYNPATVSADDNNSLYGKLRKYMLDYIPFGNYDDPTKGNKNPFAITGRISTAYLKLSKTKLTSYTLSIPTNPKNLSDAPYRMFCIPYGDISIAYTGDDNSKYFYNNIKKEYGLELATKISELFTGAEWLLDLQILPYCPCMNYWDEAWGKIVLPKKNIENWVPLSPDEDLPALDEIHSVLIWCNQSSFTFNIDYSIPVNDIKVENQCDMYRLCSPNYSGVFEFNAAKNGGVNFINVDCTYKPFNPWIHLNPNFGKLYGSDFNDSRGLICGGDFSMAQSGDKFAAYEMQNKNYQALFDRQVQNMEVMHKYSMIENVASAAGNTLQAIGKGGLLGGLVSAIGGKADLALAQGRYNETLDYTKDQFGFNLDNIKALPNSLTKTTSFSINSKYFPFIEYYTCTEEEKQAFREKIKYNGMTVGIISTISAFLQNTESYIKGKVIIQDIADDFHIANDIASEINKGVRIQSEYTV